MLKDINVNQFNFLEIKLISKYNMVIKTCTWIHWHITKNASDKRQRSLVTLHKLHNWQHEIGFKQMHWVWHRWCIQYARPTQRLFGSAVKQVQIKFMCAAMPMCLTLSLLTQHITYWKKADQYLHYWMKLLFFFASHSRKSESQDRQHRHLFPITEAWYKFFCEESVWIFCTTR